MKEGIKEALAKLNAARAAESKELAAASPKGQARSSKGEAGTVVIGSEVKYLQEPRATPE